MQSVSQRKKLSYKMFSSKSCTTSIQRRITSLNGKLKVQTCAQQDDLKHSIYECTITKISIENFKLTLQNTFLINFENLNFENVILGLVSSNQSRTDYDMAIDTILILLKRKFILQGENKIPLSEDEIEKIINSQINIEKATTKSYPKFQEKWNRFLGHQQYQTNNHP